VTIPETPGVIPPEPFATPPPRPSLLDFEPLSPAERLLLHAAARGAIAKIGYRRPREPRADVRVRAALLAFVLRGGAGPIAGGRLDIMGAAIVGCLDVTGATLPLSIWLYRCSFGAAPVFDHSVVRGSLSLVDCALPGLSAVACRIGGDLAINAGCHAEGPVCLAHAHVTGDLDAERLHLRDSGPPAHTLRRMFVADDATIGGDATLLGGVEIVGETRFVGARIGGDLRLGGARLTADMDDTGARGVALNLDRARIGSNVLLDGGFSAAGQVRLRLARIRGDLDASDADLDAVGDASWGEDGGALLLDGAEIGGTLCLRRLHQPLQRASLADTRVGTLHDDSAAWGQDHVLDGFTYRRLADDAPTDAAMRLEWLTRQAVPDLTRDFKPGPWQQLIAVLRRTGHGPSADALAIGRERHLRRVGRIGAGLSPAARVSARLGHAAWGLLAGYGLRPSRLLAGVVLVWAGCGAAYWIANGSGGFAPAATLTAADPLLARCRPACPAAGTRLPATSPALEPWLYSLDVLLPLVDLQQTRHWAPVRGPAARGHGRSGELPWLAWLISFEAVCGWALGLLGLAWLSGLADRDRHVSP
jgi:hypothetical protein